jgi:hypothetical protein
VKRINKSHAIIYPVSDISRAFIIDDTTIQQGCAIFVYRSDRIDAASLALFQP